VNFKLGKSHGVWVLLTHWVRHDPERGQPIEDLKKHLETLRGAREEVLRLRGRALQDITTPADEVNALKVRLQEINDEIAEVERNMGTRDLIRPAKEIGQIEARAAQRRLAAPVDRLDAPEDKDMLQ
jgi:hypothetical protein